jgi:hypothetical protein
MVSSGGELNVSAAEPFETVEPCSGEATDSFVVPFSRPLVGLISSITGFTVPSLCEGPHQLRGELQAHAIKFSSLP